MAKLRNAETFEKGKNVDKPHSINEDVGFLCVVRISRNVCKQNKRSTKRTKKDWSKKENRNAQSRRRRGGDLRSVYRMIICSLFSDYSPGSHTPCRTLPLHHGLWSSEALCDRVLPGNTTSTETLYVLVVFERWSHAVSKSILVAHNRP